MDKKSNQNLKSPNVSYYYFDGNQSIGPFTIDNFPITQITRKTLVWKTGESEWQAAENFSELNIIPPPIIPNNYTEKSSNNKTPHNNISDHKCWFCENENAEQYSIQLNKYKKRLGEFGAGRKYSRFVKIYMCKDCAEAFNKKQKFKTTVYRVILAIEIITCCIFVWFEPSCSEMSGFERILAGFMFGFCFGIFPAWGITALITNNPKLGNNPLRNSFKKHPDVIAANKDGYRLD